MAWNTAIDATTRAGIARISYPASTQAVLLVKLRDSQPQRAADPSSAQIVGNTEIIGNTTSGHFCGAAETYVVHFDMVFDHPFTAHQILGNGGAGPDGIFLTFNTTADKVLLAKVGLSFVSNADAKANWQAEIPDLNFDTVRTATHAAWNRYLGRIEVAGGTADQRTVFYSDLYHVLNHPNVVRPAQRPAGSVGQRYRWRRPRLRVRGLQLTLLPAGARAPLRPGC